MALYSPGRRRAILLLLLTSLLLLTIDLRGNAIFDATRTAFERGMRPFENAAEVVARPVRNAWRGITKYDDLEERNRELEARIESMRTNDLVARGIYSQYQRLLAYFNLESPGGYDRVVASVVGLSPNNIDQIIEIDKGSDDGIRVGMPVVNEAGALIGKVTTPVTADRARVMLITDTNYATGVRIVRPQTPPTSTTSTTSTTTTLPAVTPGSLDETTIGTTTTTTTTTTSTTTTSTTTTLPDPQRETGQLEGRGAGELPQVNFIEDNPAFGRPEHGDDVFTAGGNFGLAPPDIPIGIVTEIRRESASRGWILDVEPQANLDGLEFVQVILYQSEQDARSLEGPAD